MASKKSSSWLSRPCCAVLKHVARRAILSVEHGGSLGHLVCFTRCLRWPSYLLKINFVALWATCCLLRIVALWAMLRCLKTWLSGPSCLLKMVAFWAILFLEHGGSLGHVGLLNKCGSLGQLVCLTAWLQMAIMSPQNQRYGALGHMLFAQDRGSLGRAVLLKNVALWAILFVENGGSLGQLVC